jgi:hypothetical protein
MATFFNILMVDARYYMVMSCEELDIRVLYLSLYLEIFSDGNIPDWLIV